MYLFKLLQFVQRTRQLYAKIFLTDKILWCCPKLVKEGNSFNYIDIRHIVRHLSMCFRDPFEALKRGLISNYLLTPPPLKWPETQREALTDLV